MDRVVKCINDQCKLHFMYTKEDKHCPFCHTEYGEVEPVVEPVVEVDEEKPKEKKKITKNQRDSFKLWQDSEK